MSLRRALRHPVRIAARLGLKLGEVPARVVDLSREGARLSLSPAITAVDTGDRLTLSVGGSAVPALVRWRLGHQAGIAFDAPLPLDLFERLRETPDFVALAKRAPARRRPGPIFATG